MSQTECAQYWSTAYGVARIERMWCVIWSVYKLSSLDISWCFLLQVSHFYISYFWSFFPMLKLTSLFFITCSQLKDDCLSATTASCPLIESLILMSCPSIGSDGLYSLRCLPRLTILDLSYTFLLSLQPVFDSCLQLKVISPTRYKLSTFGMGYIPLQP